MLQGSNVADPIALLQDEVFVAVERHAPLHPSAPRLAAAASEVYERQGNTGMEHMLFPYKLLDQPRELGIGIDIAIRYEVVAVADLLLLQGREGYPRQILDINKGDALRHAAYGEVEALLNGLDLQEIVSLPRAIDPCGAQDNVGEMLLAAYVLLSGQLALPIGGVGTLWIIQANRGEAGLVAGAVAAEATHQEEFLGMAIGSGQCFGKVSGILAIDP